MSTFYQSLKTSRPRNPMEPYPENKGPNWTEDPYRMDHTGSHRVGTGNSLVPVRGTDHRSGFCPSAGPNVQSENPYHLPDLRIRSVISSGPDIPGRHYTRIKFRPWNPYRVKPPDTGICWNTGRDGLSGEPWFCKNNSPWVSTVIFVFFCFSLVLFFLQFIFFDLWANEIIRGNDSPLN